MKKQLNLINISLKNYNEDSNIECFLEIDIQYHDNIHNPHNDLLFLPERMKIEKVEKFAANLHDKNEDCVINIKNLTQVLNHRLIMKMNH